MFALIGASFGAPGFTPAFPIAIVPVGWTLEVSCDFQTLDGGASFWFVPMQGN